MPLWRNMQVNVLAKRLTPERVKVSMTDRRLHIIVNSPEGELEFELDTELYDQVHNSFSA